MEAATGSARGMGAWAAAAAEEAVAPKWPPDSRMVMTHSSVAQMTVGSAQSHYQRSPIMAAAYRSDPLRADPEQTFLSRGRTEAETPEGLEDWVSTGLNNGQ